MFTLHQINAGVLNVGYWDQGPRQGPAVILLHGFPYDIHAYEEVLPILERAGCRVIVPYLRGFGSSHFLSPDTPRSGEQAALGSDLLAFMDALNIPSAILAGYDWGGRAACVVAALWPERCRALVSLNSYNIQNISLAMKPDDPERDHRLWYQFYFHSERGRQALLQNKRELIHLLWRQWSATWNFSEAQFLRSFTSFQNSDFVDVVIHSYRHRYGLVPGDPALVQLEMKLAMQPKIKVPTITFDGADDGVNPAKKSETQAHHFEGSREHRILSGVGHNFPQEAPNDFAQAVLDLL